jgi:hypothetical protein
MWWILLLSVQVFMKAVDICFKSMQGLTTVISEQYMMLRSLVTNFKLLLEVEGPISADDETTLSADFQLVTLGSYSATRVSIRNFVVDLGNFVLNRWRALQDKGKRQLEDGIGLLSLSAIECISLLAAERDSFNGVTADKFPPVITRDLANIAPRDVNEVFLQQYQRLNITGSRDLCTKVEE